MSISYAQINNGITYVRLAEEERSRDHVLIEENLAVVSSKEPTASKRLLLEHGILSITPVATHRRHYRPNQEVGVNVVRRTRFPADLPVVAAQGVYGRAGSN